MIGAYHRAVPVVPRPIVEAVLNATAPYKYAEAKSEPTEPSRRVEPRRPRLRPSPLPSPVDELLAADGMGDAVVDERGRIGQRIPPGTAT